LLFDARIFVVVGSAAGKVREGVTVEMKDSGGEIKKYWAADERG
jgi:hypothetical protein